MVVRELLWLFGSSLVVMDVPSGCQGTFLVVGGSSLVVMEFALVVGAFLGCHGTLSSPGTCLVVGIFLGC